MFINKTLLLALSIPMGLHSFSLFHHEDSVEKPIYIEPIVIPKSVKEDSHREILKKLREATKETFKNAEPKEDEVAEKVLSILAEFVKIKKGKEKNVLSKKNKLARKKEVERKKRLARKKEVERKKRLARKKEIERKKRLARKKEVERKKRLARKKEVERKKRLVMKNEISLGEQDDLHSLSKDKAKHFHNLEVVYKSKEFTLEKKPKVKSPKLYGGVQKEVKLEELPFVQTLGVVDVSKPFIQNDNY